MFLLLRLALALLFHTMRYKWHWAIILLCIRFFLSFFDLVDSFFVPSLLEVVQAWVTLFRVHHLERDILLTLWRVMLAFVIAVLIWVPWGLMLWSSKALYERVELLIDFFRSLPATAIFPLFLLIFGVNDSSKIAVASFGAVLIILFNTAYGCMHAKQSRRTVAYLLGASRLQIFRFISFWDSLPQTFVWLRIAFSLCVVVIVVTEMFIGTTQGLWRAIINFQYTYELPSMYAAIAITGIIWYSLNFLLMSIERRIVHRSGQ